MSTKTIYFSSLVIFILLLFVIQPAFIATELGNTVLTISTFLLGIIAGFYIVVTTTDYNSIKNILALETASWIALYHHVLIYDKDLGKQLSGLIDEYIRRAFDYEIIDYAKGTVREFDEILETIRGLSFQESKYAVYDNIQDAVEKIIVARQQLLVLGTRTLSFFQWVVLFALALLVVSSLYGLRTGAIFFDIVTVLISSSIILILLLIRDLDLYIWNEKTFGYDIFENVLRAVGKLHYYPEESIKKGRIRPAEKEYRVGVCLDSPKCLMRRIEIRKT